MIELKNKKGFIPLFVGVALLIVIVIAGIVLSINILANKNLIFYIIGGGIIALSLIYIVPKAMEGDFNGKKMKFIFIIMGIGLFIIILASTGVLNQALGGVPVVKYAIPHMASYKCDVVDTSTTLSRQIPTDGLWLAKDSIGVKTVNVNNIKIVSSTSFWDNYLKSLLWGGSRMRYQLCDQNRANCVEKTQDISFISFTLNNIPTQLDMRYNSLFIIAETRATIFNSWKPMTNPGIQATYAYDILGLTLYSTTRDPAGAVICKGSCDLNCPELLAREKTDGSGYPKEITNNVLEYKQTAPYLEYWETFNYDLNAQAGATVYNSATNKFCFAGAVYNSGRLTLENGDTYIYPEEATRELKVCCPGAVISGTYEDKICQNDYTWKTITKDTRIKCVSDFNCPNAGQATCQLQKLSGWSCNSGFCEKDASKVVDCCINSDCNAGYSCSNNICINTGPLPPNPCKLDADCLPGEKCSLDGTCTLIKSKDTCNKWYQVQGVEVTTIYPWYNFLHIGTGKQISSPICKTSGLVYALIFIVLTAIGVLGTVIYFIATIKPKGRRK